MSSTTTDGRAGLFLVFEGVEGAGKTTHLRRLSRRLDRQGIAHIVVREPGGTRAGERIRDIVLDPGSELFPETELLLLLAARAEFV
ncbi:MAG: dTMP kinase, partial [marine benthic group bacterium]|nr:dTMP kinase [Gemmatimonadota bacterium]